MLEILMKEKEVALQIHEMTEKKISEAGEISSILMKEYERTVGQYESMYDSLEGFLNAAGSGDSAKGLMIQMIKVLHNLEEFELEFQGKIN